MFLSHWAEAGDEGGYLVQGSWPAAGDCWSSVHQVQSALLPVLDDARHCTALLSALPGLQLHTAVRLSSDAWWLPR